jgi:hypothetical protein
VCSIRASPTGIRAIITASMQRTETNLLLYPQQRCNFLVRSAFCPIRGTICGASAAARGIISHAREAPTAGKFTPRPPFPHSRRAISPAPVDFATVPARVCRRGIDPPTPRLLPTISTAPPRYTEPSPPPTGTRPTLPMVPRLPPLASGALERRPCRRRAYFQHGAAKMLTGLLARYAPPPAANIFSIFC